MVHFALKIYNTDTIGAVHFRDFRPASETTQFSNLRGYFPQHLLELLWIGTKDSTINRTSAIKNFNQITSIQHLQFTAASYPGSIAPFVRNNLGSFARNHGLKYLRLDVGHDLIPNYQNPGVVDSIAGKHLYENFPNFKDSFPEIRLLIFGGLDMREQDLFSFNFELPKLKHFENWFFDEPSGFIDTFYNQVARVTITDSGQVAQAGGLTPPPGAASATARAYLIGRYWLLNGPNVHMGFYPSSADLVSTDTLEYIHQFTSYANSRLGTNFTYAQLRKFYYQKCASLPNFCNAPSPNNLPKLCGKVEPVFPEVVLKQYGPCDDSSNFATWTGTLRYEAYLDSIKYSFMDKYLAKCLAARYKEQFSVTSAINEYHYTLYYYDQAGNLVKTVPPAGMDLSKFNNLAAWSTSVKSARSSHTELTPDHLLSTEYRYNSLNQVVAQSSPDGGKTQFWYDRLGRLSISQNAKQVFPTSDSNKLYSYTKYDYLGRITEVGQVRNTQENGNMTDAISRSNSGLNTWLINLDNRREQITQTVYDLPYTGFAGIDNKKIIQQRNLRNRVSFVTYSDTSIGGYNTATHYTYDIHGNVDTLLQDFGCGSCADHIKNMMNQNGLGNRFKKTAYKYDLISGKVNMVIYQPGWGDMFIHRYSYDAENRLKWVETSSDSLVWEMDARYEYYQHGPLARMILGEQSVQGVDYAYTLQGWLKGVNSMNLSSANDMGEDGLSTGLNRYTAKDVYGFQLNYFSGDYASIKNGPIPFPNAGPALGATYRGLFNGNISSMGVNIGKLNDLGSGPQLYNYSYDQLNRITGMDAWTGFNTGSNSWTGISNPGYYKERVAYDPNGNITKYLRHAHGWEQIMDSLTYKYSVGTNRLKNVIDNVPPSRYGNNSWDLIRDIDTQGDNNYEYDQIGNLTKDNAESITSIKWSVYGKILEINRTSTSLNPTTKINYTYDAAGNRISKIVKKGVSDPLEYTWYVRDAQGNIMSIYNAFGGTDLGSLFIHQVEKYIYGSSRIGVHKWVVPVDTVVNNIYDLVTANYTRGHRSYEMTNHLGNVLASISDKKIGVPLSGSSLIDYYTADVVMAQDYYPFGMMMPGREYQAQPSRFGFNGKENDHDVKGFGNQQDYGMRIYDTRIGKFLSVDPLIKEYPELTPYQYASNTPIQAIDLDGLEAVYHNVKTGARAGGPLNLQNYPASGGWKCETCVPAPLPTFLTFSTSNSLFIAKPKEQQILMPDIFGTGHIGTRSIVEKNVKAIAQNYYNAVGDNIRGGPFGAIGYLAAGEKGSFYGAVADNVALSFGGIPGESGMLTKPINLNSQRAVNPTESGSFEHSPLHLSINLKPNWNKEQVKAAFEKANALTFDPETKVTLTNPEPRPSNLRKQFLTQGGTLTKGQHVDHIRDLQLNGTNKMYNLQGLDGSVNSSFGKQLHLQIRNIPDNTRVSTVTINIYSGKIR